MASQNIAALITLILIRLFVLISRLQHKILHKIVIGISKTFLGQLNFLIFFALTSFLTHCPLRTIKPNECPNENVTFWLYNSKTTEYLFNESDKSSLENAPIIPYHPVKVLIHGFGGNRTKSPTRQVKSHYLTMDYNVISVDYGMVAKEPCYLQAVKALHTVGVCVGRFLRKLLKANPAVDKELIHLIGFSLGTHVAAKAGRFLKYHGTYLNRITVLDPAAPLFYNQNDFTNPRCARFIDAIHTNVGIFGQTTAVGDADFYANFLSFQKGCSIINVACHHAKSSEFYAESITSMKGFWGYPLENQDHLEIMGEYIPVTARGGYYVSTNDEFPYASGTTFPDLFDITKRHVEFYLMTRHSILLFLVNSFRLTALKPGLEKSYEFLRSLWNIDFATFECVPVLTGDFGSSMNEN